MKKKLSKLDQVDLVVDPRPLTKEERIALEEYIRKQQEEKKNKGKKNRAA